jgi:hypothetical protein
MPTAQDLRGIARFHLRKDLADADLGALAVALAGSTGAHVERIVRVARRRARKLGRELLLDDLFAALGEKLEDLPREYLERIAIHEAGHAAAAIVLKVSRNVSVSLFHLGEGSAATYFDPQIEAVARKVVERRIAVAGRGAANLLGDKSNYLLLCYFKIMNFYCGNNRQLQTSHAPEAGWAATQRVLTVSWTETWPVRRQPNRCKGARGSSPSGPARFQCVRLGV